MFWLGILLLIVFIGLTMLGVHAWRVKYQTWGMPLAALSGFISLVLLILVLGSKLSMGYLLMVILGGIAGWAAVEARRRSNAWARPLAGGAAVGAVLVALATALHQGFGCQDASVDRERRSAINDVVRLRARYLGEYLARNYAGGKALIVTPSENDPKVEAIQDALGGKVRVVDVVVRREDFGEMMLGEDANMGMPDAFTWEQYQLIKASHPEVDLVISMSGLPMALQGGPRANEFWSKAADQEPVFVLDGGDPVGIEQDWIRRGRLIILLNTPGKILDPTADRVDDNDMEAAAEMFVIVSQQTLDEFTAQYDPQRSIFGLYPPADGEE